MRAVVRSLFVLGATALCAATSSAAVLPLTGSLSLALVSGVLSPLATISGSGVATINGSGGGAHVNSLAIPASPFATTGFVLPMTDPAAAPFMELRLTVHNGAGAFGGGTGMGLLGGPMPLAGVMKFCLFAPCTSPPPANLTVPLNVVGAGGFATVAQGPPNFGSIVNTTAIGAPWTIGTAVVGTLTQMGFRHGPGSLTSSTAAESGSIRLVTPVFVSTSLTHSPIEVFAVFGTLDLHFVPEPATALLLAVGLAGVVMFGRTKRG